MSYSDHDSWPPVDVVKISLRKKCGRRLENANQKEVALSSVRCGLVVKTVYVLLHVARQALSSGRLIGLDFFYCCRVALQSYPVCLCSSHIGAARNVSSSIFHPHQARERGRAPRTGCSSPLKRTWRRRCCEIGESTRVAYNTAADKIISRPTFSRLERLHSNSWLRTHFRKI
jgi:hypothetical protein